MASTPAHSPVAPINSRRISATTPSTVLADVISYGYAAVIVFATIQFDLQFELWQGIALLGLFVALRAIANEIHKDARRAAVQAARQRAAHRAQSPARWTAEQRDGLGRRVDLGA